MMSSKRKKYGVQLGFMLAVIVLAETVIRFFEVPNWLVPAPSVVVGELVSSSAELVPHILATIKLSLLGLWIGGMFGFVLGNVLHIWPAAYQIVYPFMLISQNIPTIVLAPILIIWFGFGILPKLVIISLVCFFPIALALLDGLRQTAPELKHYFQMAGATKWQQFWQLELPSAMPALFSGIKIATTYSVMGAVITEWLGAKEGIGVFMTYAQSSFRTDRVFVAIVVIVALSLTYFAVVRLIEERYVHRYKRGSRRGARNSGAQSSISAK